MALSQKNLGFVVKFFACDADNQPRRFEGRIRHTLLRINGLHLEGSLQLPGLNDLIASTGKLATLPATVIEILSLLNEPAAGADQVQRVLERDPAMTANVLRISNSAFYGVRREIASVRDALVMLGNRRTATLALATGMVPVLRRDLVGYGISRHEFWNHALLSAAASAEVAAKLGNAPLQCEAFTAGLIHDVGMLAIDPVLVSAKLCLDEGDLVGGACAQERRLLGFDHGQAGAELARSWGFPEILVPPLERHHQSPRDCLDDPLLQAVAAGNLLARMSATAGTPDESPEVADQLVQLGLDPDQVEELCLDLAGNLDKICQSATSAVAVPV
jgi:HD-like signal output (HDOD) protein